MLVCQHSNKLSLKTEEVCNRNPMGEVEVFHPNIKEEVVFHNSKINNNSNLAIRTTGHQGSTLEGSSNNSKTKISPVNRCNNNHSSKEAILNKTEDLNFKTKTKAIDKYHKIQILECSSSSHQVLEVLEISDFNSRNLSSNKTRTLGSLSEVWGVHKAANLTCR